MILSCLVFYFVLPYVVLSYVVLCCPILCVFVVRIFDDVVFAGVFYYCVFEVGGVWSFAESSSTHNYGLYLVWGGWVGFGALCRVGSVGDVPRRQILPIFFGS